MYSVRTSKKDLTMTYRLLGILSRSKYLAGNDRPSTGIGAMKGVALIFLIGGVGMYITGKMMGHAVLPPVLFLTAMLGGFIMMLYQFSGSRSGAAMVTILCLTFASCTAFFVVGMSNGRPSRATSVTHASSAVEDVNPLVSATVHSAGASPPAPPSVPRLIANRVKAMPYLYIDRAGLAHRGSCPGRGSRRVLLSVARTAGYSMHTGCASMDDPEYETVETVHPDWREYERRLAASTAGSSAHALTEPQAFAPKLDSPRDHSSRTSAPRSSASSSRSSSGTVQVKGYTKKDGTYVPPHTRKKPSR